MGQPWMMQPSYSTGKTVCPQGGMEDRPGNEEPTLVNTE